MRDALLDRLYGAFDKSPDAVPVLKLAGDNLAWVVSDTVLSITGVATVALQDVTVADVAQALSAVGVTATATGELAGLSASILMPGSGNTSTPGGDAIFGHRSVLWAIMGAYAAELQHAKRQVSEAVAQASLHSAEGEWLDFWGEYFGLMRPASMPDAAYRAYLVTEVLRLRSNKFAIENAVKSATGKDVTIDEPWRQIFMLSGSALSGGHCFKDGKSIGRNLIQPIAAQSIDWTDVMPIINRNRSAGVVVLAPQVKTRVLIETDALGLVFSGMTRELDESLQYLNPMRLDRDAMETVPTLNHRVLWRRDARWLSLCVAVDTLTLPMGAMKHGRDYRLYTSVVKPSTQSWGVSTWNDPVNSWGSLTVGIISSHTRTP